MTLTTTQVCHEVYTYGPSGTSGPAQSAEFALGPSSPAHVLACASFRTYRHRLIPGHAIAAPRDTLSVACGLRQEGKRNSEKRRTLSLAVRACSVAHSVACRIRCGGFLRL